MAGGAVHQASEFREEEFSPDIQALEEQRLQFISKQRTLIRNKLLTDDDDHDYINDDSDLGHDYINDDVDLVGQYSGPGDDDIMVMSSRDVLNTPLSSSDGTAEVRPRPAGDKSKREYINQEVVDQVANERVAGRDGAAAAPAPDDDTCRHVPSSNGYRSHGAPTDKIKKSSGAGVAPSNQDTSHMTEFEKRLFLAKHRSQPPMPDIYDIPWYHPGISRHIAECLLLSKMIRDGTYLLRDCVSEENTVTLSVRCADSVKHYKVVWDGKQFVFGLGKFPSLEDFKQHFAHKPVISSDSGVLVQLCYSYPRGVSEPAIYHDANVIGTEAEGDIPPPLPPPNQTSSSSLLLAPKPSIRGNPAHLGSSTDLSVNSKEGYLTKLGFHRKNWKKRWFVLYRNELKYYNNCGDKEPLKTINLADVDKVERDGSIGKPNCLKLVTNYRTFYMYATSEVEAIEWLQILDWRLKQSRSVGAGLDARDS